MVNGPINLREVEGRLRDALENKYQQAESLPELILANSYVHTALEDAFKFHLGDRVDDFPTFSDKAEAVVPEQFRRFDVSELNQKRNQFAHPKRNFGEAEIKDTVDGFAQFSIASWKELFGSSSQPPIITTPSLSSLTTPSSRREHTQKTTTPVIPEPRQEDEPRKTEKVPWRFLIGGLILLLPVPWLAGFSQQLWRKTALEWYWLLLLTGFVSLLFLIGLRYFWRFFRTVGFKRTVGGLSVLLVMVTLALIPSTEPGAPGGSKAGAAVDRLLTSLERATLGATRRAFNQGQDMADVLFLGREAEPVLEVQPRGTATPTTPSATTAVTATEIVEPTLTATPRPLPPPSIPLAVGMQVVVTTGGGRLNLRVEPSTSSDIVTPLEHGTELTIIGGPQAAEGFTWWEVEGAAGRGWSAGQYLAPISP